MVYDEQPSASSSPAHTLSSSALVQPKPAVLVRTKLPVAQTAITKPPRNTGLVKSLHRPGLVIRSDSSAARSGGGTQKKLFQEEKKKEVVSEQAMEIAWLRLLNKEQAMDIAWLLLLAEDQANEISILRCLNEEKEMEISFLRTFKEGNQGKDVLHSDLPGASSISVTDEIAHKMADNVGAHALSLQRMLGLISSTPLPPAPEQSMGSLESYIRGFFHTINTGNLNDLLALPSIGETRANKILKVRAEGLETPFKSHEDFTKIDLSKPLIKTMMKQVVAHFLEKQWN